VTGIGRPGRPVRGSIGVSAFPTSLFTYSVRRSQDGTTCWGRVGTRKRLMIVKVAGSITSTVFETLLGTYTRAGTPWTAEANLPPVAFAYTLNDVDVVGRGGSVARGDVPRGRAAAGLCPPLALHDATIKPETITAASVTRVALSKPTTSRTGPRGRIDFIVRESRVPALCARGIVRSGMHESERPSLPPSGHGRARLYR
jgi:hypothetical protein